jgi:cation diffusion facilitator CzcD-associated flavoprotein CzcO
VEIIERHSGVGGLWDIANPGTPMYRSCHYISSRNTSAYPDYPMPTDYADYPSNAHILAYIQGFARKFDLIRLAWTARDDWSGFMIS